MEKPPVIGDSLADERRLRRRTRRGRRPRGVVVVVDVFADDDRNAEGDAFRALSSLQYLQLLHLFGDGVGEDVARPNLGGMRGHNHGDTAVHGPEHSTG